LILIKTKHCKSTIELSSLISQQLMERNTIRPNERFCYACGLLSTLHCWRSRHIELSGRRQEKERKVQGFYLQFKSW